MCAEHGTVSTAATQPRGSRAAGRFEPRCPVCRRAALSALGPRGGAGRSTQRLRGDQAAPGAPLLLCLPARRKGPLHGAALPQRLRPEDAPRHALRRSRQHLPQLARIRRRPRRSSRTGSRSATSSTSATSPGPTCWRSMPGPTRPASTTSPAAGRDRCSTWPGCFPRQPGKARPRPWSPASSDSATCATSSPTRPGPAEELGFDGRESDWKRACRSSRPPSCRLAVDAHQIVSKSTSITSGLDDEGDQHRPQMPLGQRPSGREAGHRDQEDPDPLGLGLRIADQRR